MNILKFNFLEEKPRTVGQNITSSHWWENAPTQYFWVFTGRDENNYLQTLRRVQMIFCRNARVEHIIYNENKIKSIYYNII